MMNERQRVIAEALLLRRLRNLVRVDDDLYVDLGYISHIEYQLFLDEKRATGEYYQPDHWQNDNFPKGQAHWPVVGVRSTDAVAFCAWLTQHDATLALDGWRYRLPGIEEVFKYGLAEGETAGDLAGYWTQGSRAITLVGVGKSVPILTKAILEQYRHDDLASDLSLDHALDRVLSFDRALNLARARARAFDLNLDLILDLDFDHALDRALDRVLDRTLVEQKPLPFLQEYIRLWCLVAAAALQDRAPAASMQ